MDISQPTYRNMAREEREARKPKERISESLRGVKHEIAVMSGKGGVGKSTVAANLSVALSALGLDVGLMDCDMHGPSIPKILGITGEKPSAIGPSIEPIRCFGVKVMSMGPLLPDKDSPVIWRGPLKMKAMEQFLTDFNWGNLDYMIFDLPPGTGDEPLSIAQLIPDPDGALIVTTPQEVAVQTIKRAIRFAEKVNLPVLGIVENMSGFVCPSCGEKLDIFKSGGGVEVSSEFGIPFLGKIPLHPRIMESGELEKPFVLYRNSKLVDRFNEIVNKIVERIKEGTRGEDI